MAEVAGASRPESQRDGRRNEMSSSDASYVPSAPRGATTVQRDGDVVILSPEHPSALAWMRGVWRYRQVAARLARADFEARYKRAVFGMAWAIGLPLIQSAVIAVVFSRLIGLGGIKGFAAYVLAGITMWSYFSPVVSTGSTAVVDQASLTDKIWFSRSILPTSAVLSNLPGLGATIAALLVAAIPLGGNLGLHTLWMIPGIVLLILFVWSLSMVLAALHVYFRDIRFMVQAVMLLWFYVTPIAYPARVLGNLGHYIPFNPMSGIVAMFHMAVVQADPRWHSAVVVTIVATLALFVVAVEVYRRRDRVLVDLL